MLNSDRADACVAALSSAGDCVERTLAIVGADCEHSLQGTLRLGSPCTETRQCVDGAYCSGGCPGQCESDDEPPELQLGAPCVIGANPCEPGLTCEIDTQACRSIRDIYQTRDSGEACAGSDYCKQGLTCDRGSNTCALEPRLGINAATEIAPEAPTVTMSSPPQRAARESDGSICTFGAACTSGYCVLGTCGLPELLGEACSAHSQCVSGYCGDDDECATRPQCFDEFDQEIVAAGSTGQSPTAVAPTPAPETTTARSPSGVGRSTFMNALDVRRMAAP